MVIVVGRLKISSLAHAVHLPERYRDSAQRYYNLAVVNRFTRGRRSDFVAAVCLYAVCRTEKSSHMLIDFSDILQVKKKKNLPFLPCNFYLKTNLCLG